VFSRGVRELALGAQWFSVKRDIELRAAAAVAFALGARAQERDPGGGATSIRDFDLVFTDRSDEPLEVTTYADQAVLQTWSRLERLDREAPSLKRTWALDMPSVETISASKSAATDVDRFMAEAEIALKEIEAAGYERFDAGLIYRDATVGEAARRLLRIGCQFGFSHPAPPGESGRIQPGSPVGGVVTPDLVTIGVEAEASKNDNRVKLREPADAQRRHLFVLFDASSGAAFSAVPHTLDSSIPILPEPITTAWVAGSDRVFSVTPPEDWVEYAVPQDVYDHPEKWIER
jgi:hypothetical protein